MFDKEIYRFVYLRSKLECNSNRRSSVTSLQCLFQHILRFYCTICRYTMLLRIKLLIFAFTSNVLQFLSRCTFRTDTFTILYCICQLGFGFGVSIRNIRTNWLIPQRFSMRNRLSISKLIGRDEPALVMIARMTGFRAESRLRLCSFFCRNVGFSTISLAGIQLNIYRVFHGAVQNRGAVCRISCDRIHIECSSTPFFKHIALELSNSKISVLVVIYVFFKLFNCRLDCAYIFLSHTSSDISTQYPCSKFPALLHFSFGLHRLHLTNS